MREFDLAAPTRRWLLGLRVGLVGWLCFAGWALYRSLAGTIRFRGSPPGEQQPMFWIICAFGVGGALWLLWRSRPSTLVVRAALGDGRLRAVTRDGREHVLDLAAIEVVPPRADPLSTIRHTDGTLRVLRFAGREVLDRLGRAGGPLTRTRRHE